MQRELPDLKVTPPVEGEKVSIAFHADGKQYELPVLGGTHGPKLIDVRRLYAETGYLTYDPGFMSTASCDSAITYIDGEAGILLHRGYPIEDLAAHADFLEICYLLLYSKLPSAAELAGFRDLIVHHSMVHEQFKRCLLYTSDAADE